MAERSPEHSSSSDTHSWPILEPCLLCNEAVATGRIDELYVCDDCNTLSPLRDRFLEDTPDWTYLPFVPFPGDGPLAGAPFEPLVDQPVTRNRNLAYIEAAEAIYHQPAHFTSTAIAVNSDRALTAILESANQQLPRLLEWTRELQYFSNDGLSEEHRFYLLSVGWLRLLLFNLAIHSAHYGSEVMLADGTILTPSSDSETVVDTLRTDIINHLIEPLRGLNLNNRERGLLRVILLFNATLPGFQNNQRLSRIRNSVHCDFLRCRGSYQRIWDRCVRAVVPLANLVEIADECFELLLNVNWASRGESVPLLAHLMEQEEWPRPNSTTVSPSMTDVPHEPPSEETR